MDDASGRLIIDLIVMGTGVGADSISALAAMQSGYKNINQRKNSGDHSNIKTSIKARSFSF